MAPTPGQSGARGNDFSRVQEDKAARCANLVTRAAQSGVCGYATGGRSAPPLRRRAAASVFFVYDHERAHVLSIKPAP